MGKGGNDNLTLASLATKGVPVAIAAALAAVFWRACYGRLKVGENPLVDCVESVFMTRNPMFMCLMVVFTVCIPTAYLWWRQAEIPLEDHLGVVLLFAVSNTAFFAASFTDPGTVTPETLQREVERYTHDAFWYPAGTACKHGGLESRPARSKYCHVCKRTVSRYDHHCPWTNTCIGRRNYPYFLLFLGTSAVSMTFISWVVYKVVHARYLRQQQQQPPSGVEKHVSSWLMAFPYGQREDPVSIWTISLAMSGAMATGSMLAYHMGLVSHGVTTAEGGYIMHNTSPFTHDAATDASRVWPFTKGGFGANVRQICEDMHDD